MDSSTLGVTALFAMAFVPVVSALKRATWTAKQSYLVSFGASLLAAFIGAVIDGNVRSWSEALAFASTAVATAQTVYMVFFRETETNMTLEQMGNE